MVNIGVSVTGRAGAAPRDPRDTAAVAGPRASRIVI
jgi:hypothetical protein